MNKKPETDPYGQFPGFSAFCVESIFKEPRFARLRQLNIGLLQGLAQGKAQRRRKNDSDRAVKNRGRDLQQQRRGRSGGGKTADQQPIVGKGLEK